MPVEIEEYQFAALLFFASVGFVLTIVGVVSRVLCCLGDAYDCGKQLVTVAEKNKMRKQKKIIEPMNAMTMTELC